MSGVSRPALSTWVWAVAVPCAVAAGLSTTLAMTLRPRMLMPGAPPTIRSTRSTWLAGMRRSTLSRVSVLEVGGLPSISTLPVLPSRPRKSRVSSTVKPGSQLIMSSAVDGRTAVKKVGG